MSTCPHCNRSISNMISIWSHGVSIKGYNFGSVFNTPCCGEKIRVYGDGTIINIVSEPPRDDEKPKILCVK